MPEYTLEDVARHSSTTDCWIAIDGKVYDVTSFAKFHPGGTHVLLRVGGKDVTELFHSLHTKFILPKFGPKVLVGTLAGAPPPPPPKQEDDTHFGELVPYGDPAWYQGYDSPYYNDSHRRLRKAVREFVDREIVPFAHRWDEAKKLPKGIHEKFAQAGILNGMVGSPYPKEGPQFIAGNVNPEEYDYFHELIIFDELARPGSGGIHWGISAGLTIGLPPVINFANQAMKDKVVEPCLKGEKIICLCITEPYAGSDVANLQCLAEKTPDGKNYIVNGEKKWITNGVFADYFTVAVRTGGPGMKGISLLLLEKDMPGLNTKQMKCSGVWPSGTTYITMENVKVPVENLIGEENKGFKCIMYNFNHERWWIIVQVVRYARVCYEESFNWSLKRKTFGKRLIDHPVIRFKLGEMARQIESTQCWLEHLTYQMCKKSHDEQKVLAGPIALAKVQATKVFEYCAREAAHIFGGLSYTRGGQGEKVERMIREVRAFSIPAGSEEIMLDLGVRQAMKTAAKL